MDLQYLGNEDLSIQLPSSDVDQASSAPSSPNQPDIHAHFSDRGHSDFNLDGNAEPVSDPSECNSGDEGSVPADSTEFHPLVNGMYINYYIILQLLNKLEL
jgi:hypothetical protein